MATKVLKVCSKDKDAEDASKVEESQELKTTTRDGRQEERGVVKPGPMNICDPVSTDMRKYVEKTFKLEDRAITPADWKAINKCLEN